MGKKSKRSAQGRQSELERALRETQLLMAQAYNGFNAVTDSELLDSYIYEIQSLRSRYSYLLRQRKELEGAARPTARLREAFREPMLPATEPAAEHTVLPVA